jgi:two-component system, OmpR family, response regulator BaeR
MQSILIVEDEVKLANILVDYFDQQQFHTHCLYDGLEVVQWLKQNPVDAIILDLMLPGKDGLQLCREIREFSNVPILMVTARVEEIDRLIGLELGADDYICKPFSPREVVARVKTVLRRVGSEVENCSSILKFDEGRFQVALAGNRLELTVVEFRMLHLLASEPGRIFSRQQLMDSIYSDNRVVSDRTIDSHIKKLRKKLEAAEGADLIHSVYSVGYKLQL